MHYLLTWLMPSQHRTGAECVFAYAGLHLLAQGSLYSGGSVLV